MHEHFSENLTQVQNICSGVIVMKAFVIWENRQRRSTTLQYQSGIKLFRAISIEVVITAGHKKGRRLIRQCLVIQ